MRSLDRKAAIRLPTQNPKGFRSHGEYFGSEFDGGNPQVGDDQSRADRRRVRVRGQFLCGGIIILTSCE